MPDRFTDRARKVMGLSRQAAVSHGCDAIDADHIFLGLAEEGAGLAAAVLRIMGAELVEMRQSVESQMKRGNAPEPDGLMPFTSEAGRVLESSLDEAALLGHTHIGTEHLLLGLLGEDVGIAARVLREWDVDRGRVRDGLEELTSTPYRRDEDVPLHEVVAQAALDRGDGKVDLGHVFLALLEDADGVVVRSLRNLGVDLIALREEVGRLLDA